MMNDRRTFARIKIKIPLKFLNPLNEKKGQAETVDISANGIGFVTGEDLPPQTPLEIWLDVPDHHEPLHLLGRVAWSTDADDHLSKRIGVQLEEQRLIGVGRVWHYKDTHPEE